MASNHPFALAPGHGDKSELTDPQAGTHLCFAESRPPGGDGVEGGVTKETKECQKHL